MKPLSASMVSPRARMPEGSQHLWWKEMIEPTSDSREPRIFPALDESLLHEVLELSLRQQSVHKVESTGGFRQHSFEFLKIPRRTHLKSKISILGNPSFSKNHSYCGFRSAYSFALKAWVTPSSESTTGHARSYIGYALYLSPVT